MGMFNCKKVSNTKKTHYEIELPAGEEQNPQETKPKALGMVYERNLHKIVKYLFIKYNIHFLFSSVLSQNVFNRLKYSSMFAFSHSKALPNKF